MQEEEERKMLQVEGEELILVKLEVEGGQELLGHQVPWDQVLKKLTW